MRFFTFFNNKGIMLTGMLTGCWLDVDWMLTGRWTATWGIPMVDAMGYSASHTMILPARLRVCAALRELECAQHCACLRVRLRNEPQEGTVDGLNEPKLFAQQILKTITLNRPLQVSSKYNCGQISIGWLAKSCISFKNIPFETPHLILKNGVVASGCMGCFNIKSGVSKGMVS